MPFSPRSLSVHCFLFCVVLGFVQPTMAEVEVYAQAHISFDQLARVGEPAGTNDAGEPLIKDKSGYGINNNQSRIGLRGDKRLAADLRGVFQFEWQADTSDSDGDSSGLEPRNMLLGISGRMGTIFMGHHDTPLAMSSARLDPFYDTVADYNAVIGRSLFMGKFENEGWRDGTMDQRYGNMLAYASPQNLSLSMMASYMASEDARTFNQTTQMEEGVDYNHEAKSFNLIYQGESLYASVGYLYENDINLSKDMSDARIGLGYHGESVRLGVVADYYLVESNNDAGGESLYDGEERLNLYTSLAVKMGNNTIKTAYGILGDNEQALAPRDSGARMMAVGVSHFFNKDSEYYLNYMILDNDGRTSDFGIGPQGAGSMGVALKDSVRMGAVSLGMRLDF